MIELNTARLLIRTTLESDAKKILEFEAKNKQHWSLFASSVGPDTLTDSYQAKKFKEFALEFANGQSVRFLLFDLQNTESIIGTCNFTQIFRGAFQACYLGYKIDYEFEGKGLMFEALESTIKYMFDAQNIHRIMANYLPTNKRSEKLLLRLGFQKEGYAEKYLLINDVWEDHILTSLTNSKWKK